MKTKNIFALSICLIFMILTSSVNAQMIAEITENVQTDFGVYQPIAVEFTPAVPPITVEPDFSNVTNFSRLSHFINTTDSAYLHRNHFAVKKSQFKQLFDVYNDCTWDGTPIFVTTDAVLHIYHVLFDFFLSEIEMQKFVASLDMMTDVLIDETESVMNDANLATTQEALNRNLAFLYVAKKLLNPNNTVIPEAVEDLVNAEINLIEAHDGFHFSPIFGGFSELDYSQFNPRGHYTKNDTLKSFFKAMMWYGWTIFTMEPDKFGELAERHTVQALMLVQIIYNYGLAGGPTTLSMWDGIYEPTVFFVGKTDDPNIRNYKLIGETVYGSDFLNLPPDSLTNTPKLNAFMEEAQKIPEPKIPNWIYGTFVTYKGFRFMGQRFIPDSYMLANLIDPFVGSRMFPKGLDIMSILGSNRAYKILDEVYHETAYGGYVQQIDNFKNEFSNLNSSDWAQNLYWNWLYCLMPLFYENGDGYPFFMQTDAWRDKEVLTALASWAELRHDTILYAKQSMTPCGMAPGAPKSYVEPNPHLYARLASLVRYTKDGLNSRDLLLDGFSDKLELFEKLLLFLTDISVKELENIPLTEGDYGNIFCFGRAMKQLVSVSQDPHNPWKFDADDMAVVADVHTDSNSDLCLEEGVGYPLEIFVIIGEGESIRLTRGAIFSYYEFTHPIADRLTDEKWREMLTSENQPELPQWTGTFMTSGFEPHTYTDFVPDNLFHKEFTTVDPNGIITLPQNTRLLPNYPNPFNPGTSIRFELDKSYLVRLEIYNILGQKIVELTHKQFVAGEYNIQWNGKNYMNEIVPTGLYICKMTAGEISQSIKMFLIQ
jgi:hypothetical protein